MILASNSPRRQEILRDAGFQIKVLPANIDEKSSKTNLIEKVKEIAYKKAFHIAQLNPDEYVLAADTIVEINGLILAKPVDEKQAREYLNLLSGKKHRVITAYSFINIQRKIFLTDVDISEVKFYDLDCELIEYYLKSGEAFDKAGAYGIQGKGRMLVERIEGDFFSIMGFPIAKFIRSLKNLNIDFKDISKI
ncbi:MAG: Maf family protein [Fusobacterium sp.]|uniref:Maf family protein n=1 Tax=Fusobacterium sp. TaxID=68766 RepID=UPI0026DC36A9|nr:Maf family protein [Fusobacterium sp.]MDO4690416.1 Maf family protein [Fusobacterium sp.]